MTHDRALEAIRNKDLCLDRQQLDARNSDVRPATFEEVVASLYNDERVEFFTECLPDLHITFAEPIDLHFQYMPGGEITAEDVKKKVGDARAKLIQVNKQCRTSG